jgi:hypothetical protein
MSPGLHPALPIVTEVIDPGRQTLWWKDAGATIQERSTRRTS